MSNFLGYDVIHVNNINLWAHVGVLHEERLHGQAFLLDFSICLDLKNSAINDDLGSTVDYSLAISALKELSININCLTIEHFSEKILDLLEDLYGKLPIKVLLTKCSPPVDGFNGTVAVERLRNMKSSK